MKQVTIKIPRTPIIELTGWLFEYAGLRLVAIQETAPWWATFEYSTGRKAIWHSAKTRKEAIRIVKEEFDQRHSMQICECLETAINENGILNA